MQEHSSPFISSRMTAALLIVFLVFSTLALGQAKKPAQSATPTVAEAQTFIEKAEKRLAEVNLKASRAAWIQANFITDDTEAMAADANEELIAVTTELATAATRFNKLKLPPELARKMMLLKLSLTMPAPKNPVERKELTKIATSLEADYGKGKFKFNGKDIDLTEAERIMRTNRDPNELLKLWTGWRTISPSMRDRYARFVDLSNKGAREMGFPDTGAMWRSNYDMPPDKFAAEVDRLWEQMKPLYVSLHAYVRWKLAEKYGKDVVPENGMIPAHLLGNMWSQEWGNISDIVEPKQQAPTFDLTAILKQKKFDELKMVRSGENFFTSLGFAPLPETFWKRSLFKKPADRDVVCHASAWDIDSKKDVRLKMCIEITDEHFRTIHHELGHNFYQRAYMNRPVLFQNSANDGFHEAIGDTIALSVTPEYLRKIGLLQTVPPPSSDIGLLLDKALEKIAFLPFGIMIDQWRWKVFSGQIKPADYNKSWWELINKYQGVTAPVSRTEKEFDPGAKYHVPANVPYTRYFLASVLQFQFHRALCREAGFQGPLNRCSIYGNKKVGEKLNKMLEMGQSRPWPEALYELTGEKEMDATAILDYFAPLKKWLDEQNKGHKVGWTVPAKP